MGSHRAQAEKGRTSAKGNTRGHFHNSEEFLLHALRNYFPRKVRLAEPVRVESEKTSNSDRIVPHLKIIGARYVEGHATVKLWQKCIQATQGPHVQHTNRASACFPK